MKKTIISILLFLLSQLFCTVIASLFIMIPEFSGIEELTFEAITEVLADKMIQITVIGLLMSQIVLFFILWGMKYFKPKEIVKKVPIAILFIAIPLIFSALLTLDIINSSINLPNILEEQFQDMSSTFMGFLTIAICGPIIEEIVFRRIIIDECMNRLGKKWVAIFISAFMFGIIHLNPAQVLFAFMAGTLFGWLYCTTGSILPGVIGHIINNTVAYLDLKYGFIEKFFGSETASFSDGRVLVTFIISTLITAALIFLTARIYEKAKERDLEITAQ